MTKLIAVFLAILSFFPGLILPVNAQVRPVYDMGAIGLGQALKRLQTTASVMHTGAHPDDEDSGLLAYLARHDSARTVYLSLTRGDGGQNVIGSELFESLGVIRTEELLQARRLDGGEQMFTRAMDYGFSKKLEEAKKFWDEKVILKDMVRAIRTVRPMVVISRFSGTPADGHGQHQFAGYLTPLAVKAAADPNQFPELIGDGYWPWRVKKLYVSRGFSQTGSNDGFLTLNTGDYDSLIGRSYFEIAMEGRSQHRTQEQGVLQLRGRQTSALRLVESTVTKIEKESSVFDGVDISISGIAGLTGNSEDPFKQKLTALQQTAELALKNFEPLTPQKIVPTLVKGYQQAVDAEWSTRNPDSKRLLKVKQAEFVKAIMMAGGIVVDALNDTETMVPGESTNVAVRVFAPESAGVKVKGIKLRTPNGWTTETSSEPQPQPGSAFRPRREDGIAASFFKVVSGASNKATEPYWLESQRQGALFDWDHVDKQVLGQPFQPPLISAEAILEIDGVEIPVEKEVEYRYADDVRGEIRRRVDLVPELSVSLDQKLLILQQSSKPQTRRIVMTVTNNSAKPIHISSAGLNIVGPEQIDWKYSADSRAFELKTKGEKKSVALDVTIPPKTKPGSYYLYAQVMVGEGLFTQEMNTIAYPHIQTHRFYTRAEAQVKVLDLKVAPVNVGYIMGSGDKVPEAIRRMGLNVTMLNDNDLASGNLAQFDCIVVGIRASQTRPDFVANNNRLLDYVKNGGTLIVQYQQGDYTQRNLTPFPAKIGPRVVDENAKISILQPNHPVFNYPNKIGDDDWKDWVQERNLYCFTEFDKQYVPLLESHDEGEPASDGGMVYADIGKGRYVYTAYSWFRQLPAGNPGAYRIFANMLSLAKARK